MSNAVILLLRPDLNVTAFSSAMDACLHENPLRSAKGAVGSLQHTAEALRNFKGASNQEYVDNLIQIGFLIGADERDLPEILEVLSLPHVTRETKQRGVYLAVVTGTVEEFKFALRKADAKNLNESTNDVLRRIETELKSHLKLLK